MSPASRTIGLARALSKLGYCSRSQAWELIGEGRVKLNGVVERDPEGGVKLGRDRIEVDDRQIGAQAKVYLMLNKPRGVVTSASDEKGRTTVYSSIPEQMSWIAPVGRLDKASEGLLLFTNDSEWAARVTAPKSHLEKRYHVRIDVPINKEQIEALEKGFRTQDGDYLRVISAKVLRGGERRAWLEIILDEGKNRHIRRMFAHLGIEVLRLVRVAVGPLTLGELPKGATRALRPDEKKMLDEAIEFATFGSTAKTALRPGRSGHGRRALLRGLKNNFRGR